jgi:DNA-binding transcriptional LysR family regulator
MPWNDRVKRRLKLRDLDILMVVVRTGSMGNAARHLNMSQPAVSKAIADLELATGVRLLDRSRQGIEPTPYGLALLKRGVVVFDELRHGIQDIDFLADPTAGELRIGTTEPIAAAIVAPVIERFNQQYPRMRFHVTSGDTETQLYKTMLERDIELVISRIVRPVPENCSAETLFHDSLVVAAGADNPLIRRRRIELADLMDEAWVLQPLDSFFGALVAEALCAAGLAAPRLAVNATSLNLRNEMLATGRFLTVVPGFSLRLPRKHPSLRALPVELPKMQHPIAIITLKDRSLSHLAQLFIERVSKITKPLAGTQQSVR